MTASSSSTTCDVIVFVTGNTERDALRKEALRSGGRWVAIGDYFDLGNFGGDHVAAHELVMSDAARIAFQCHRALADTSATSALLLGTAFGVSAEKQRVGDLLVASGIRAYDHADVRDGDHQPRDAPDESESVFRRFLSGFHALLQAVRGTTGGFHHDYSREGNRPAETSPVWRARCADLRMNGGWNARAEEVYTGTLLSGGARIHSTTFLRHLVERVPERDVIGGEMEACGFAAACEDSNAEWIIIKGISDFANELPRAPMQQGRALAAHNSAEFAMELLRWRRSA